MRGALLWLVMFNFHYNADNHMCVRGLCVFFFTVTLLRHCSFIIIIIIIIIYLGEARVKRQKVAFIGKNLFRRVQRHLWGVEGR